MDSTFSTVYEQPVAVQYMSKKTTDAEKKKHSYGLEILTIIEDF